MSLKDLSLDEYILDYKETTTEFGLCPECKKLRIPYQWCQPCSAKQFETKFDNWESERKELNNIIKESQLNATGPNSFLEWIDINDFCEIKFLNEGRFVKTYSAIWKNGYIQNWNYDSEKELWKMERILNTRVILHYLPSFETLLEKVRDYLKLNNLRIFRKPYGVSKDPSTQEWMIVLKYEIGESLYSYLSKNFYQVYWLKKLDILVDIIEGLSEIHKVKLIHKNLNPNMVLVTNTENKNLTYIDSSEIFNSQDFPSKKGVLPYIAPEILRNEPHTMASDIYSFGIIMSILATGQLPYQNYFDDIKNKDEMNVTFAVEVHRGLRPEIEVENVPNCYQELMNKCWDHEPSKRPSALEIVELITNWWQNLIRERNTITTTEFKIGDEMNLKNGQNKIKFDDDIKNDIITKNYNLDIINDAHVVLQHMIRNKYIRFIPFNQLITASNLPIGKGHFGSITRATWTKTNNYVVLKRLTNTVDIKNKELKAFIHELRMHLRLDTSNRIIRCLGISQDEDKYLLVMEYADCGDLCDYLKENEKKINWDDKKKLSFQIAEGLDYLHREDILHRDLHSKNIVIHDHNAKITDFGMSRVENNQDTSIHSNIFGVMPYMEPQRLMDKTFEYKKYSDIYSLGVLMWQISSCRRPFEEYNQYILQHKLIDGLRETPVTDTPREYESLYKQCWDKDVEKRPTIQQVLGKFLEMGAKESYNHNSPKVTEVQSENNSDSSESHSDDHSNYPIDFDSLIIKIDEWKEGKKERAYDNPDDGLETKPISENV